ncbi:hypothetical protein B4Q13_20455, partial [Lacticaseibacillus rhamnosus]
MFVGPILTGVLLGLYGPGSVFFLTSAGALIGALLTRSLPLRRSFVRDTQAETIVTATFNGLHELRHNTGALLLTLVVGAQWVVIGALDVLTVVFGIDVLNMGPNCTTFLIPVEVFPTRVRGTAHGIAAASGKAGAVFTAFSFAPLPDTDNVGVAGVPSVREALPARIAISSLSIIFCRRRKVIRA